MPIEPDPIEFLRTLLDIARLDDRFSKDEKRLIDRIARDLKAYENAVDEALRDQILTADETQLLVQLHKRVLENAAKTAAQDNIITDEESAILKKLFDYFKKISIRM